ncbi:DUF3054 domain-containing protein [Arthrobacter sp.]|uniref:DUF3054 domain-containing protein n=1 Tax=Arthrobacter sp. TaxID=1667 RepID=UPI0028117D8C|nr:DUF3054 domain-containing protein [Arthrobacter sp.]
MTSASGGGWGVHKRGYVPWLAVDVVLIAFFALLGRLSHYGTLSPQGILSTALPFLIAYVAASLLLRAWRQPTNVVRTAIPMWLVTAGGGLLLRVALGESAALSFQMVTLCVLGVFLVVPRSIAARVLKFRGRHTQQRPAPHSPSQNQGAAT